MSGATNGKAKAKTKAKPKAKPKRKATAKTEASSVVTAASSPKAAAYVVAKLRELDVALVDTTPRLLAHHDDDEAVHDLRVAIRRMRTLLKMARGIFGRWHTDVVREAFAEVMRATGDLRDEEVLEETLEGAAEGPEYDSWLRHRKSRETKLRRAVIGRIERGDLDRARLMLKALLVFPVAPDCNVELARFARRTVERARRKVEDRRDVEIADVVGLHDLRIAYKELRYSIELLADALPIDARAQLEPATVFQKRLGELHDVDVATDVVQKAKGLSIAARTQALQSLATLRDKRVGKYLRELDPLGAGAAAPRAIVAAAAAVHPKEAPTQPIDAMTEIQVRTLHEQRLRQEQAAREQQADQEDLAGSEHENGTAVQPELVSGDPDPDPSEPGADLLKNEIMEDAPTIHIRHWSGRPK